MHTALNEYRPYQARKYYLKLLEQQVRFKEQLCDHLAKSFLSWLTDREIKEVEATYQATPGELPEGDHFID